MKPRAQLLNLFLLLASAGALISCLGWLGTKHYWFDLISNFSVQALLGLLLALIVACIAKRFSYAALFAIVCVFHGTAIVQSIRPIQNYAPTNVTPQVNKSAELKVVSSNLWVANDEHARYLQYLNAEQADIVFFQEYTQLWAEYFDKHLKNFPYRVEVTQNDAFGIAVWSKHPIIEQQTIHFVNENIPSILATVDVHGSQLTLLGTHPIAPVSKVLFESRNQQLDKIADLALSVETPFLVAGDFNITPWSVYFKRMLNKGQLTSARNGHGLNPTWPAGMWPLLIPIDHVLVNKQLMVSAFTASKDIGSDHRSISATVQFR